MILRHYGLTGKPVSHSLSPAIFREIFRQENISDASYMLYPLDAAEELPFLISGNPLLFGLNVTTPYKEKVVELMDELDNEAEEIGAVNCIRIDRGAGRVRLEGFNTDGRAFHEAIAPHLGPQHHHALVLGSGGAAKAVVHALKKLHIGYLSVSREPENSEAGYEELKSMELKHFTIIVNATPLGMFPDVSSCPDIPYEKLSARHLLYDLVYHPAKTLFMTKGESYGAKVLNGMKMLWRQAELSWQIWNEKRDR